MHVSSEQLLKLYKEFIYSLYEALLTNLMRLFHLPSRQNYQKQFTPSTSPLPLLSFNYFLYSNAAYPSFSVLYRFYLNLALESWLFVCLILQLVYPAPERPHFPQILANSMSSPNSHNLFSSKRHVYHLKKEETFFELSIVKQKGILVCSSLHLCMSSNFMYKISHDQLIVYEPNLYQRYCI